MNGHQAIRLADLAPEQRAFISELVEVSRRAHEEYQRLGHEAWAELARVRLRSAGYTPAEIDTRIAARQAG